MKTPRVLACCAVLIALPLVDAAVSTQTASYDLLIRDARIVDGTGNPWYRGDVAVRGDTIARIAPSISGTANRVIDAAGQVIAPGFIDIHTHARRGIFEVPTADNYVRQGVTTLIEGPDGSSPVPLRPFLEKLAALPRSVNIGSFIGQGSIRAAVVGDVDRTATADEIARMQHLVQQGMRDGAFGLSTGLFYVPGTFTPTAEVVSLAVYARDKRVLTLEEAVRKMTSYPAQRLSLADRGVLRTGLKADLVGFDPAHVRDMATFERPHQYAEGFSLVVVNGAVVYEDGAMTAARPGVVLYGPGTVRPAP